MAPHEDRKNRLEAALRANLRRRKAQAAARSDDSVPAADAPGVRYSGFRVRGAGPDAPEDGTAG